MRKILAISVIVVLLVSVSILACGCEPYKKYPSLGVELKTTLSGKYVVGKYDYRILDDYSQYVDFGVDLHYGEDFFANRRLLAIAITGCSTNAYQFADIKVNGDTLHPVIGEHPIKKDSAVTDDIICYVFYAELNRDIEYKKGDIFFADNSKVEVAPRSITAIESGYAKLENLPNYIEVTFNDEYTGTFVIDDEEQMQAVCDTILKRTYVYDKGRDIAPGSNIALKFVYGEHEIINMPSRYCKLIDHRYVPQKNDSLDGMLAEIGLNKGALTER